MMACAPLDDDPCCVPRHAPGKNLTKLIKHLRKNLGCSVLFIHNHLRVWVGVSMPPEELLRCIARITQARPGTDPEL